MSSESPPQPVSQQRLDYARGATRSSHSSPAAAMTAIGAGGALIFASLLVVVLVAGGEPFRGPIKKSQAFAFVGVGTALIAMWIVFAVGVLLLVYARFLKRPWLALVLLALLGTGRR